MVTLLSHEIEPLPKGLQVENVPNVIRSGMLADELMVLIALLISTLTMALVASVPSTFCVSLFMLFIILVLTVGRSVPDVFNTLGPELKKLDTANLNKSAFSFNVSLVTGIVRLEFNETTVFTF